jgi:FkbM family methyltransferase
MNLMESPSVPPVRIVTAGGLSFAVNDRKESFWERLSAGMWEPELVGLLPLLARPGRLLLDIGVWVAPVTLIAAANGARVIGFEPDAASIAQARGNLACNPALAERVTLVPKAVTASGGPMRYGSPRKPGDGMGGALWAERGRAAAEVASLSVADVLAMIGDDHDILLKLDIEGGEYDLIPALGPLLARASDVLVSLHPKVLRQAAVLPEADIAARTETALAALADFDLRFLDNDRPADVGMVEASRRDCALHGRKR